MAQKKKKKAKTKKTTRRKPIGAPSAKKKSGAESALGGPFDYENIETLLSVMKKHGVSHYEWESGSQRLSLSTGGGSTFLPAPAPVVSPAAPAPTPVATPTNGSAGKPVGSDLPANQKKILSPFVGTFYRASGPGSDPFVSEGSVISKGDTLCIVEAMKLMNEIEAETSGKVVKILVENEQPVEFGEPLFLVEVMS